MFDKLIDKLLEFVSLFYFVTVIYQYQDGVRFTLGKASEPLGPGVKFYWPLRIGDVHKETVVLETKRLGPMSLTTLDEVPVVIGVVISFHIVNVKTFLVDIEGRSSFIQDICTGPISKTIMGNSWAQLMKMDLDEELAKKTRQLAKRYGVHIDKVQVHDFTRCRSIRLVGPPPVQVELLGHNNTQ